MQSCFFHARLGWHFEVFKNASSLLLGRVVDYNKLLFFFPLAVQVQKGRVPFSTQQIHLRARGKNKTTERDRRTSNDATPQLGWFRKKI